MFIIHVTNVNMGQNHTNNATKKFSYELILEMLYTQLSLT